MQATNKGIVRFESMRDVNFTSPADLDLVQFDSASSKWVNRTLGAIADSRYVRLDATNNLGSNFKFLPIAAGLNIGSVAKPWDAMFFQLQDNIVHGIDVGDVLGDVVQIGGFKFLNTPVLRNFSSRLNGDGLIQNVSSFYSVNLRYAGAFTQFLIIEEGGGNHIHQSILEAGDVKFGTKGMDFVIEGNALDQNLVIQNTSGESITLGVGGGFGVGGAGLNAGSGQNLFYLTTNANHTFSILGTSGDMFWNSKGLLSFNTTGTGEMLMPAADIPILFGNTSRFTKFLQRSTGNRNFEITTQNAGNTGFLYIKNTYGTGSTTLTTNTTVDLAVHTYYMDSSSNSVTATLPTAVGIDDVVLEFVVVDNSNLNDIATDGSETINGSTSNFPFLFNHEVLTLKAMGGNWVSVS